MTTQPIVSKVWSFCTTLRDEPASVLLGRIRAEREKAVQNNHAKRTKKRKTRA